jgi:hypothetical protein
VGIHSVTDNGKEPSGWTVLHFADVGTSEEWVQQLAIEMPELVDASLIRDPEPQKVKESIFTILFEGLIPAFEDLKLIRVSGGAEIPILNRRKHYEDFARVLWHAYKDLMPKTALLMGFDIGFIFQNDKNFEKGLLVFQSDHPHVSVQFGSHLRDQRTRWQNALGKFRNHYLEHREDSPDKYEVFYRPDIAEAHFDAVWRSSADVLFLCLASRLIPGIGIEEIPVAERNPERPRRFRYVGWPSAV